MIFLSIMLFRFIKAMISSLKKESEKLPNLILSMFGAETRAELDEYISKQIGKKRRNGVFPNCDSRDEIIKLVETELSAALIEFVMIENGP